MYIILLVKTIDFTCKFYNDLGSSSVNVWFVMHTFLLVFKYAHKIKVLLLYLYSVPNYVGSALQLSNVYFV